MTRASAQGAASKQKPKPLRSLYFSRVTTLSRHALGLRR